MIFADTYFSKLELFGLFDIYVALQTSGAFPYKSNMSMPQALSLMPTQLSPESCTYIGLMPCDDVMSWAQGNKGDVIGVHLNFSRLIAVIVHFSIIVYWRQVVNRVLFYKLLYFTSYLRWRCKGALGMRHRCGSSCNVAFVHEFLTHCKCLFALYFCCTLRSTIRGSLSQTRINLDIICISNQWPLLLTWFNFNPSMDK